MLEIMLIKKKLGLLQVVLEFLVQTLVYFGF